MARKWIGCVVLVVAAVLAVDRSASAQWGCFGPFYPWCSDNAVSVPYFRMYPPVYYGYSLLKPVDPWWPMRPAAVSVARPSAPQLIVNPYVVRQPETIPTPAPKTSGAAARIINPHIAQR